MTTEKLHLTISCANGDWEHDFPPNQLIHAVKTTAMAHLHMDPSQASQFVLTLDGQILEEAKTLGELRIPNDSLLMLERKEVIKI